MFFVEDIKPSRDWYSEFLCCEPAEDFPNFSSFAIGNSFLNLHLADRKSPLTTGGQVAYWSTDNFDGDIERAVHMGAVVWRGPLEFEPGRRICQIKDPFGNVFGLENW
jgi:predicted enzyme related to lactoylglutathione lyase